MKNLKILFLFLLSFPTFNYLYIKNKVRKNIVTIKILNLNIKIYVQGLSVKITKFHKMVCKKWVWDLNYVLFIYLDNSLYSFAYTGFAGETYHTFMCMPSLQFFFNSSIVPAFRSVQLSSWLEFFFTYIF